MAVDPQVLTDGCVRVDADGAVLVVTLDRPAARNAQTPATWRALAAIGASLSSQTRAVVLRGAGESFSAGLDRALLGPDGLAGEPSFAQMAGWPDGRLDRAIAGFQEAFTWWSRPDVITVAAVQGHAIGAGLQLALACDLRVVTDDVQLSMRETTLGLVPDLGGTGHLVRTVGYSRALEICVTGRAVGADEALRLGIAHAVVAREALDDAVHDLVATMLVADPDAVRETKALLSSAQHRPQSQQLAAERSAQARRLRALAGEAGPPTTR